MAVDVRREVVIHTPRYRAPHTTYLPTTAHACTYAYPGLLRQLGEYRIRYCRVLLGRWTTPVHSSSIYIMFTRTFN